MGSGQDQASDKGLASPGASSQESGEPSISSDNEQHEQDASAAAPSGQRKRTRDGEGEGSAAKTSKQVSQEVAQDEVEEDDRKLNDHGSPLIQDFIKACRQSRGHHDKSVTIFTDRDHAALTNGLAVGSLADLSTSAPTPSCTSATLFREWPSYNLDNSAIAKIQEGQALLTRDIKIKQFRDLEPPTAKQARRLLPAPAV